LEFSHVFERTLGNDSDIVGKELYSFTDKGGDHLTLRPEGTAGNYTAYLECDDLLSIYCKRVSINIDLQE